MALDYSALECALAKDLACTGVKVVFGEAGNTKPRKPPYVSVSVLSIAENGVPWEDACYDPCADPLEEYKIFYRQCRNVTLRFEALTSCLGLGSGAGATAEQVKLAMALGGQLAGAGWNYIESTSVVSETFSRAGTRLSRSIFDVVFGTVATLEACPTTFIDCFHITGDISCATNGIGDSGDGSYLDEYDCKSQPYPITVSGFVNPGVNPAPWSLDITTEPEATVWVCIDGKRLEAIETDLAGLVSYAPPSRYQVAGTYQVRVFVKDSDCIHSSSDLFTIEVA